MPSIKIPQLPAADVPPSGTDILIVVQGTEGAYVDKKIPVSAFALAEQGAKADNALPATSYTADDVIAKVKSGDGHGSGIDADTLDGKEGALYALLASPAFSGAPTAPTAAPGTNTTQIATTAFIQAAVAALVNASPAALDTLKELATALGNDANFATTMTNALAAINANLTSINNALPGKASLGSSNTFSGTQTFGSGAYEHRVALGAGTVINLSSGNYFSKTITGITGFTVSNVPAAGTVASFILDITNGGAYTVTWWSGTKWSSGLAPTLTASGRDVIGFFTHDGGVTWTGLLMGKKLL